MVDVGADTAFCRACSRTKISVRRSRSLPTEGPLHRILLGVAVGFLASLSGNSGEKISTFGPVGPSKTFYLFH